MHGGARLIKKSDVGLADLAEPLIQKTNGNFAIATPFQITVARVKPIVAPSYAFSPETTEQQQIADSLQSYQVKELLRGQP